MVLYIMIILYNSIERLRYGCNRDKVVALCDIITEKEKRNIYDEAIKGNIKMGYRQKV